MDTYWPRGRLMRADLGHPQRHCRRASAPYFRLMGQSRGVRRAHPVLSHGRGHRFEPGIAHGKSPGPPGLFSFPEVTRRLDAVGVLLPAVGGAGALPTRPLVAQAGPAG